MADGRDTDAERAADGRISWSLMPGGELVRSQFIRIDGEIDQAIFDQPSGSSESGLKLSEYSSASAAVTAFARAVESTFVPDVTLRLPLDALAPALASVRITG